MSVTSLGIVKRLLRRLVVALAIFILVSHRVKAGPLADFFHKVRYAITHPEQKSRTQTKTHKKASDTPVTDYASRHSEAGDAVSGPPKTRNTRSATVASKKKGKKNDLRYGVPVPGKQGLVTSPFAPDSGYIDVRGFPPGTEVKDPYTGKVFLTP